MAAEAPAIVGGGTALDSDDDDEIPLPTLQVDGTEGFTDSDVDSEDGGVGSDGDLSAGEAAVLQGARKPKKRRRSGSKKPKAVPKKKKSRNIDIRRFVEGEAEEDDEEDAAYRNRGDDEEGAAAEAAAARYRQEAEERKKDALASKSIQDIAAYYEQRNK